MNSFFHGLMVFVLLFSVVFSLKFDLKAKPTDVPICFTQYIAKDAIVTVNLTVEDGPNQNVGILAKDSGISQNQFIII